MPPAGVKLTRNDTPVPEKRQPWKEHWDALAASEFSGSGTSHGFKKGEQVVMDGNVIKHDGVVKKPDDDQEVDSAEKKGAGKEKDGDGSKEEVGGDDKDQDKGKDANGEGDKCCSKASGLAEDSQGNVRPRNARRVWIASKL